MAIKQNGVEESQPTKVHFGAEANSVEYARKLDCQDPLKHLREQFTIPSVSDLRRKELRTNG